MDELEIEVTSLHSAPAEPGHATWQPAAQPLTLAAPPESRSLDQPGRRLPEPPLPPRPRRLVTTLPVGASVLLALLIVLVTSQPGLRTSVGALVRPPTPTFAPLPFEANIFFVAHEVPWGVLTVDGKQQSIADLTQYGMSGNTQDSVSFALARGRHTIEYVAAPFRTLRCTVSVPADTRDTCPLTQPPQGMISVVQGAARVLDLQATPEDLPADKLATLFDGVIKLLAVRTAPVPVSIGEQYLAADGSTATATQPLQATLFREPWNAPSGIPGWTCTFLCPWPVGVSSPPGSEWQIVALVRQGYTYATPDGTVVVPAAPIAGGYEGNGSPSWIVQGQIDLLVRWDGAWRITVMPPNDIPLPCSAAKSLLANLKGSGAVGPGAPQYNDLPALAAANLADGCVVGLQQIDPSTGKAMGQPIELLYRFGLLLVTDDAGHQHFAGLPFATPREQAITQQILARGH